MANCVLPSKTSPTGYGTVFAFRSKLLHAQTCTNRRSTLTSFADRRLKPAGTCQTKNATDVTFFSLARPTGFEPAISSVTGRRDRPLHYGRIRIPIVPGIVIVKAEPIRHRRLSSGPPRGTHCTYMGRIYRPQRLFSLLHGRRAKTNRGQCTKLIAIMQLFWELNFNKLLRRILFLQWLNERFYRRKSYLNMSRFVGSVFFAQ
jgi:hypothetical protein